MLSVKREFARLALGMFATSFQGYPLGFRFEGRAAAADRSADVIEITGEGDFIGHFFLDATTHLPVMVTWQAARSGSTPMQVVTKEPGGATRQQAAGKQPKESQERPASPSTVQNTLYFAEYRTVDAVKLPFRLTRASDGRTAEELTVERYRLNPKIGPREFEPPR